MPTPGAQHAHPKHTQAAPHVHAHNTRRPRARKRTISARPADDHEHASAHTRAQLATSTHCLGHDRPLPAPRPRRARRTTHDRRKTDADLARRGDVDATTAQATTYRKITARDHAHARAQRPLPRTDAHAHGRPRTRTHSNAYAAARLTTAARHPRRASSVPAVAVAPPRGRVGLRLCPRRPLALCGPRARMRNPADPLQPSHNHRRSRA